MHHHMIRHADSQITNGAQPATSYADLPRTGRGFDAHPTTHDPYHTWTEETADRHRPLAVEGDVVTGHPLDIDDDTLGALPVGACESQHRSCQQGEENETNIPWCRRRRPGSVRHGHRYA